MIRLSDAHRPIKELVQGTLESLVEIDQKISAMALYTCPWAGWVMISVETRENNDRHVEEWKDQGTEWLGEDQYGKYNDNCPDFAFPEWGIFEFPEWRAEYENADPWRIESQDKEILAIPIESGDDGFNEPFFAFLVNIMRQIEEEFDISSLKLALPFRLGVQCLDSVFWEFWVSKSSDHGSDH